MAGWTDALARIAERLAQATVKAVPAFLAYIAGRKGGKEAADEKTRKARGKAQEAQDEKDREFEALNRDDRLAERMRAVRQRDQDAPD